MRAEHDVQMSEPAKARIDGAAPEQRLARARSELRTALASPAGTPPQAIKARTPIKALPQDLTTKAQARVAAGFDPLGTRYPRGIVFTRVVVPSTVLALVDLVLLVAAIVADSSVLATVSAVLFAVFGGIALASRHFVASDPLRLSARDRLAVVEAGRWRTSQDWSGPLVTGPESALAGAAARAGSRIVASPAWTSGQLASTGVVLALGAELDQVDAAAFTIATARAGSSGTLTAAEADDAWPRMVTRVAALTAYADTVAELGDAPLDQPDVETLAFFLSGAIYEAG